MAMQTYLYPPSAARFGLHGSYDPDLLDLGGHQMSEMNLLTRATAGSPGYARLLALGAVDHVLALHDQGFEDFPRVGNVAGLFSEPIRVFRVPSPLPHAYVVEASRVLAEPAAYRALLDPSFDPSHEVVLAAAEARAGGPQFRGQATLVDARPDRVRLEVEANRSGYLVLVDAHAPGWKVAVDGHDAPLLRANVLFRAVAIAPGRHSVEFRYRPAAALAGVGISALSLVGWAWLSRTTSATAGPSRKPVSSAC
jgi:hypothetical protein